MSCHGKILALFNDKVLVNLLDAQGIIRLQQKVGDQRLEATCERALMFSNPKYSNHLPLHQSLHSPDLNLARLRVTPHTPRAATAALGYTLNLRCYRFYSFL